MMRIAPVGLAWHDNPATAFRNGCEFAAITHGHPTGYLAAGFLAAVIAGIIAGQSLRDAIGRARDIARDYPEHGKCLAAVDGAVRLARQGPATSETVERLGQGWVAEEALAIALFCSLTAKSFAHGVALAVNHGGDSDSTGAITGNILGTLLGRDAIPRSWLEHLELREEIEELASDLFRHFGVAAIDVLEDDEDEWRKYPGC